METRNLLAEIFFSLPTHIWVIPVAAAITFFGLRAADRAAGQGDNIKRVMYGLLIALAVIESGYLAVFPPVPELQAGLARRELLPNYVGRFALDVFFTFVGGIIGVFGRSKL